MGVVRKTLSVATLGVVSFRSKKEKLRRADRARLDAESVLEEEQHAREQAELRIAAAEKRLKHAESEATRTAQKLEKEQRKRRNSRKHRAVELSEAADRGRRMGRKARKAARKATEATKSAVAPRAEKVASKIGDAIDQAVGG